MAEDPLALAADLQRRGEPFALAIVVRCEPPTSAKPGAKGIGESATVGAPAAIANAVVDALWHLGVRHLDIPITPEKVWKALRDAGVND